MRISDWSSDVCSSDLSLAGGRQCDALRLFGCRGDARQRFRAARRRLPLHRPFRRRPPRGAAADAGPLRSEEHTSELQSLMRISYAVFCLKKKTTTEHIILI